MITQKENNRLTVIMSKEEKKAYMKIMNQIFTMKFDAIFTKDEPLLNMVATGMKAIYNEIKEE